MARLDHPAYQLNLTSKQILGILETLLEERHWKDFDLANVKLVYKPYWFFNYDVYKEEEVPGKGEVAQEYGSQMVLDARKSNLEPMLMQILNEIPVESREEIKHDVDHDILKQTVTEEEGRRLAKVKLAGKMKGVSKDDVVISGVDLRYVPMWRIWVDLKGGKTQRIDIDGISGSPFNIQKVPERERGFMEVTKDTLEDLKKPEGWVDYSKKAFRVTASGIKKASKGEGKKGAQNASKAFKWLFGTRAGRYTFLAFLIVVLVIYILYFK